MLIRMLLTVFSILDPIVLVNFVSARCVTTNGSSLKCDSIFELSDVDFNESLENVRDVKRLPRSNSVSMYRYFFNLEVLVNQRVRIRTILEDILKNLPVKSISIVYEDFEEVIPGAFQNLSTVQKLTVTHNDIFAFPSGLLGNLPELKFLNLSNNHIVFFKTSALENLPRLSELQLDHNVIQSITIHTTLSHPEQLEILGLHHNLLTSVSNAMLQKMTRLKSLNLGFNKISTIEVNAFEQAPELQTLVLSHNKLRELDGNIFTRNRVNVLENLYLDNNELMFLPLNFFNRVNNLAKITLVGNPWVCKCLDVIFRIVIDNGIQEKCQDKYVSGKRPICVNSDATSKRCTYKYESELSDIYLNHKKEFPLHFDGLSCDL